MLLLSDGSRPLGVCDRSSGAKTALQIWFVLYPIEVVSLCRAGSLEDIMEQLATRVNHVSQSICLECSQVWSSHRE